ncbi:uncharacterized protein LOC144876890 [Branchiostoma floridae x Branchiostoma japonicum]
MSICICLVRVGLPDMAELWARIQAQKASLLRDLEPRHMLNDLLQHGVLDDDEHERVKRAGVTKKDRTEALLDVLKGKEVEELAAFMQLLDRLYHHLAEQIRTAEKEKVEKVIPTPRNCRLESSTRDSLTVAWDQIDAVPGGSVEVAIFAHGNDQEPVQRREVGCDQTDVRMGGLRAGTKYDAQVRVVSGELRGPQVVVKAKTETLMSSIPLKYFLIALVVAVVAVLVMLWVTSTGKRCLYPKHILDTAIENRPRLFGREEDIANLTMILEKKSTCLVSGLSGVGKTAMVKEYLYRKSSEYTAGIVWITSKEQVNFLFVDVLREVTGRDPIEYDYRDKSFDWTAEYLSKTLLVKFRGKFLFVFDDVETSKHASDLLRIVPDRSVHGVTSHVIFLSRREISLPNLKELPIMALQQLSAEAAVQLYRSLNTSDVGSAQTSDVRRGVCDYNCSVHMLVDGAGYLPHSIIHYYRESEAMHIKHGIPYTADDSADLLEKSLAPVRLDLTGYGMSKNPIVEEIKMVKQECPKAYELLVVLSFFDHNLKVPCYVLKGTRADWEHPIFNGESYYELLECLKKHSLIRFDTRPCEVSMNWVVIFSVIYALDNVESEGRYLWTALEMSVRAVERLRQLSLTCPHKKDSPECRGLTDDKLAEMFSNALEHSDSAATHTVVKVVTGRFDYCHAESVARTRSSDALEKVWLSNPKINMSSWPVITTQMSHNDVEYSWPIPPWRQIFRHELSLTASKWHYCKSR